MTIAYEEAEERVYDVAPSARIKVEHGQVVSAGEQLTDGSKNPQDVLRVLGKEEVQRYMVEEVQDVYRSQGVSINYKHIELIVRQMLQKAEGRLPWRHRSAPRRADRSLHLRGEEPPGAG